MDAFVALQQKTQLALEHPTLTELHQYLVGTRRYTRTHISCARWKMETFRRWKQSWSTRLLDSCFKSISRTRTILQCGSALAPSTVVRIVASVGDIGFLMVRRWKCTMYAWWTSNVHGCRGRRSVVIIPFTIFLNFPFSPVSFTFLADGMVPRTCRTFGRTMSARTVGNASVRMREGEL